MNTTSDNDKPTTVSALEAPVADETGAPTPPAYASPPRFAAAPEYGVPHSAYVRARTSTLAIVSLVASLLGLFLIPLLGSVAGVVFGHMALEQIKRTGEEGTGQALAGTITGYVGLAFGVPAVVALFAFLPLMMASLDTYL